MKNLHFGCFFYVVDGWVNADITPHSFIARVPFAAKALRAMRLMTKERYAQHEAGIFRKVQYLNLTRRFPYGDAEFDHAFSSHVLEHLEPEMARFCLGEVCRVLKPGGVVRISVPDLDLAVRTIYDPAKPESFLELIYTPDQAKAKNRHHWMYTEQSLTQLLRDCGFSEAHRCAFQQGRCPDLHLLDNRPEISLFVEAVK